MNSLKSDKAIRQCLAYSDDPETLKEWILDAVIEGQVTGEEKGREGWEGMLRCLVSINGFTFDFFESKNSMEKWEGRGTYYRNQLKNKLSVKTGLLYSVLACAGSDYYCPDAFGEFCADFGYDEDSRKAEEAFHSCRKQARGLRQAIDEKVVHSFPS